MLSALYTDYSYAQGSITEDELNLIRDIIAWCKNPKEYVEGKPAQEITIPITIVNNTESDANRVALRVKGQGSSVIKEEVIGDCPIHC